LTDLSVIILAPNRQDPVATVIRETKEVCADLKASFEIIVADSGSGDATAEWAAAGATVVNAPGPGYGAALRAGLAQAAGEWILTMDADLSHSPRFIERLWAKREAFDLLIASRYVRGSYARMPWLRSVCSRMLNGFFRRLLALPVHDVSSGFRLHRAKTLAQIQVTGAGFEVLEQVLVGMYNRGSLVAEAPFYYRPRQRRVTLGRFWRLALDYARTAWQLWKTRNSIEAADYDFRGFYSRHPFQRYWQRRRYRIVTDFIDRHGPILDVGCGSGVFSAHYPRVTGTDANADKIRFLSQFNPDVRVASALELPFADGSFTTVVCSQVIEHLLSDRVLPECARVLAPGGEMIVGTVDYGSWQWPTIEALYRIFQPAGYADEHVNRYTRPRLRDELRALGLELVGAADILRAEFVIKAVKPKAERG